MKKSFAVFLIGLTLILMSEVTYAQQSGFGVGAVINGPTGLSYKAWIDQRVAIGGALSFTFGDGLDSFYTQADVEVHSKDLFSNKNPMPASLNLYYGGGVGLTFNSQNVEDDVDLRGVVGTTYGFEDAPMDLFFE
ncbi:MAG TPA: hypothetical protein VJ964_13615, partial [Balneolaceae bacterium]|nr:hypothetical protein [Balneolaceae bacterium]